MVMQNTRRSIGESTATEVAARSSFYPPISGISGNRIKAGVSEGIQTTTSVDRRSIGIINLGVLTEEGSEDIISSR